MKFQLLNQMLKRSAFFVTLAAAMLFSSFSVTFGQITFAQFSETWGWNDFVFTNGGGPSCTFVTANNHDGLGLGTPVSFRYQNVNGLAPSLTGPQAAHLRVLSTTTATVAQSFFGTDFQPLDQGFTITITRDTPAGGLSNLLTIVVAPVGVNYPNIVGASAGNSALLQATGPGQAVTYTSDFINFAGTNSRNMALSFSSVTPQYGKTASTFVDTFSAAASGTFAANVAPVVNGPTAGAAAITGRIVSGRKANYGAGVNGATVTVVEANGTRHVARTSPLGEFQIDGIESGQNVTVSVQSKLYTFAPMVLNLNDSVSGLVISSKR